MDFAHYPRARTGITVATPTREQGAPLPGLQATSVCLKSFAVVFTQVVNLSYHVHAWGRIFL